MAEVERPNVYRCESPRGVSALSGLTICTSEVNLGRMSKNSFAAFLSGALVASVSACGVDLGSEEASPRAASDSSERRGVGIAAIPRFSSAVSFPIDPRRSLAVTDAAILSQIKLKNVLAKLAAQGGVAGVGAPQLFQQLWDTQNPSPGLTSGPHCTDNGNQLNSFPYACRAGEGIQASTPGTSMESYQAVGLFNRFDLAPVDGTDCGEYRIVFSRGGSTFIIFEAVLANPQPALGLEGCRAVTDFWSSLTNTASVTARGSALKSFYFTGLPGFQPVIHINNYGMNGLGRATGQVRINSVAGGPWLLREFKLQRPAVGTLKFVPVTDKTNPFGNLFQAASAHPQAPLFRAFLSSQVATLATADVNRFLYVVPDAFNTGESNAQGGVDRYVSQFSSSSSLAFDIQTELTAIGSSLTPSNIVARAQALSCAGCHQLSNGANLGGNLSWPFSAGFVHSTAVVE